MKELMCKKRRLLIDTELKKCDECYKKQLSGFIDKPMCQGFNLMYYENEESMIK
jgi:hypothetical protein